MKAIFNEKLVALSSNDISDYVGEWCITGIVDNVAQQCLCGKTNNTLYTFMNKENKNTIYVCFLCIGKFMNDKKEDAVILCKQHTYQKTSKNPKRLCHGCHKHNINNEEESWRTICKSCWGAGTRESPIPILGHKLCESCFVLNIPPTSKNNTCTTCYKEKAVNITTMDDDLLRACGTCGLKKLLKSDPAFKDKCSDCFRLSKLKEETEEKRECIVCREFSIPISKPDYVDKCTNCFKSSNNVKRECSLCKELKIPISQPAFKDKCIDCYKLEATKFRECTVCFTLSIPCNKPKYITKCEKCYTPKANNINIMNNNTFGGNNIVKPNNDFMRECIQCHQYVIPSNAPEFKKKCNECLIIKHEVPLSSIPDIKVHKGNLDMISLMMGKK